MVELLLTANEPEIRIGAIRPLAHMIDSDARRRIVSGILKFEADPVVKERLEDAIDVSLNRWPRRRNREVVPQAL